QFNCAGKATLQSLAPFTPLVVSQTVALMDLLSCYGLVICNPGTGNYTLTLPPLNTGFIFFIHNQNGTNTVTLVPPPPGTSAIYYTDNTGTAVSASSFTLKYWCNYILYSEGINWIVFLDTGTSE